MWLNVLTAAVFQKINEENISILAYLPTDTLWSSTDSAEVGTRYSSVTEQFEFLF